MSRNSVSRSGIPRPHSGTPFAPGAACKGPPSPPMSPTWWTERWRPARQSCGGIPAALPTSSCGPSDSRERRGRASRLPRHAPWKRGRVEPSADRRTVFAARVLTGLSPAWDWPPWCWRRRAPSRKRTRPDRDSPGESGWRSPRRAISGARPFRGLPSRRGVPVCSWPR